MPSHPPKSTGTAAQAPGPSPSDRATDAPEGRSIKLRNVFCAKEGERSEASPSDTNLLNLPLARWVGEAELKATPRYKNMGFFQILNTVANTTEDSLNQHVENAIEQASRSSQAGGSRRSLRKGDMTASMIAAGVTASQVMGSQTVAAATTPGPSPSDGMTQGSSPAHTHHHSHGHSPSASRGGGGGSKRRDNKKTEKQIAKLESQVKALEGKVKEARNAESSAEKRMGIMTDRLEHTERAMEMCVMDLETNRKKQEVVEKANLVLNTKKDVLIKKLLFSKRRLIVDNVLDAQSMYWAHYATEERLRREGLYPGVARGSKMKSASKGMSPSAYTRELRNSMRGSKASLMNSAPQLFPPDKRGSQVQAIPPGGSGPSEGPSSRAQSPGPSAYSNPITSPGRTLSKGATELPGGNVMLNQLKLGETRPPNIDETSNNPNRPQTNGPLKLIGNAGPRGSLRPSTADAIVRSRKGSKGSVSGSVLISDKERINRVDAQVKKQIGKHPQEETEREKIKRGSALPHEASVMSGFPSEPGSLAPGQGDVLDLMLLQQEAEAAEFIDNFNLYVEHGDVNQLDRLATAMSFVPMMSDAEADKFVVECIQKNEQAVGEKVGESVSVSFFHAKIKVLEEKCNDLQNEFLKEQDRSRNLEQEIAHYVRTADKAKHDLKRIKDNQKKEGEANQITRKWLDIEREEAIEAKAKLEETKEEFEEYRKQSRDEINELKSKVIRLEEELESSKSEHEKCKEEMDRHQIQVKMLEQWREKAADHFSEIYSYEGARVKQMQFQLKKQHKAQREQSDFYSKFLSRRASKEGSQY